MVNSPRFRAWVAGIRDVVIFVTGIFGILHQTLFATEPSEVLLLLFGAMIGLPAFFRMDERGGK